MAWFNSIHTFKNDYMLQMTYVYELCRLYDSLMYLLPTSSQLHADMQVEVGA